LICQAVEQIRCRARCLVFALTLALLCSLSAISRAQSALPVDWIFNSFLSGGSVAYSPDGTLLAVGGTRCIQIYNASTGEPYRGLATQAEWVSSIHFSSDSKTLLATGLGGSGGVIELWNVSSGKLNSTLPTTASSVYCAAWSPDNKSVVDCGSLLSEGLVELWNVSTQTRTTTLKTSAVQVDSVAFSPDGKSVADGGYLLVPTGNGGSTLNGVLELWNITNSKLITTLKTSASEVNSLAISPDGSLLADCGGVGVMELWSLSTHNLVNNIPTREFFPYSIAFSPDGSSVADCGTAAGSPTMAGPTWYGLVESWPITASTVLTSGGAASQFNAIAYSPDGKSVACAGVGYIGSAQITTGSYGVVDIFDTDGIGVSKSFQTGVTANLSSTPVFSPDGKTVLAGPFGAVNYGVSVWSSTGGNWLAGVGTGFVSAYAYSPDGKSIATGGTGSYGTSSLQIWNAASNTLIQSFKSNVTKVTALKFSPDGTKLAVGGTTDDYINTIEIWSTSTDELLSTLNIPGHYGSVALAFSPDGKILADSSSWINSNSYPVADLQLWDVSSGTLIDSLDTAATLTNGLAFSPDGKTIALGGQTSESSSLTNGGLIEVWNVQTESLVTTLTLEPGTGSVGTVGFTSDGTTLYAGSYSGVQAFSTADYSLVGSASNFGFNIAISPDGTLLASTDSNGGIDVCSLVGFTSTAIASITLSPSSLQGGVNSSGTITLAQPAPAGGTTIGLYSSGALMNGYYVATVPETVFIPAGATSATFTVTTYTVGTPLTVAVTAYSGPFTKTANLQVLPAPIQSLSFSPSTVLGGKSTTGTITLNGYAAQYEVFAVTCSNPAVILPKQVTSYGGNSTVVFGVNTVAVNESTVATIIVSANNSSQSATITILPASISQLTVDPTTIRGGAGGKCTVTLNGKAGPLGTVVSVASSNASLLVPSHVTVPAGLTEASFAIRTEAVSSKTSVVITGRQGGLSRAANCTLIPSQLVSVLLNPDSVVGGNSSVGTVTLNGPAGPGGATVHLTSSVKSATLPATLVVPAGKTSATFTVKTIEVASSTTASIGAALNGVTRSATLSINTD